MFERGATTHRGALWQRPGARRLTAWFGVLALFGVLVAATDVAAQERSSPQIERELEDTTARASDLDLNLGEVRGTIADAEEELAAIGARLSDARARLRLTDGQVALGEEALTDAELAATTAQDEHRTSLDDLAEAEATLAEEEETFTSQLVNAFKYGTTGAQRGAMVLEVIRRAEDPNAFAVGLKQLQIVVDAQDATVQRFFALRDEREARARAADAARAEALSTAATAEQALEHLHGLREDAAELTAQVEVEEAAQHELLESLRTTEDETEALVLRVAARQSELEQELIDQRAREEAARQRAEEEARQRAAEEEARQREAEQAARDARRREEQPVAEAPDRGEPTPEKDSDGEDAGNGNGNGDGDAGDGGNDADGGNDTDDQPDPGSGGGPPVEGLACPVVGAVAGRDFSNDWGFPRSGGRSHQGNDLFAARGTPVVAVQDAVIVKWNPPSSPTALGGITVTYRTADGSEWYNAHLDSVAEGISPGASVTRGQQIGTVGNTGNAITTPPHLHLGRSHGGGWVNPWPTISVVCR